MTTTDCEIEKAEIMNRDELIHKFFKKHELFWIRKKDGYRFDNDEMNLAINHYIETGAEP